MHFTRLPVKYEESRDAERPCSQQDDALVLDRDGLPTQACARRALDDRPVGDRVPAPVARTVDRAVGDPVQLAPVVSAHDAETAELTWGRLRDDHPTIREHGATADRDVARPHDRLSAPGTGCRSRCRRWYRGGVGSAARSAARAENRCDARGRCCGCQHDRSSGQLRIRVCRPHTPTVPPTAARNKARGGRRPGGLPPPRSGVVRAGAGVRLIDRPALRSQTEHSNDDASTDRSDDGDGAPSLGFLGSGKAGDAAGGGRLIARSHACVPGAGDAAV